MQFAAIDLVTILALAGTGLIVTAWAAQEWSMKAAVPEFYEPLRQWVNGSVQLVYTAFGLLAMAGYGWSILRTGVLPRWVGWVIVGWIGGWLVYFLVRQVTLPPILIIPPILLGIALIMHNPDKSRAEGSLKIIEANHGHRRIPAVHKSHFR